MSALEFIGLVSPLIAFGTYVLGVKLGKAPPKARNELRK